jgi:hypothetical protein
MDHAVQSARYAMRDARHLDVARSGMRERYHREHQDRCLPILPRESIHFGKPPAMGSLFLRSFQWSAMLACIGLASCTTRTDQQVGKGAGFSYAYFGATDLHRAMRDPACAGVRFYNARRSASDTRGTVIMIGVRTDKSELDSLSYRMYDQVKYSMVTTFSLSRTEARRCCFYMPPTQAYYCSEFTKDEIVRMLSVTDCGGILLDPVKLATGNWSMKMSPVKFSNSGGSVLPAVSPKIDLEPCPNACGATLDYINK